MGHGWHKWHPAYVKGRDYLLLTLLIMPIQTKAAPAEGIENFGLLGRGKATTMHSARATYHDPVWMGQYTALEYYGGTPLDGNYLSFGAMSSIHPNNRERSAAFLKYDLIFLETSSFALKYAYENWKFLESSKDSAGIDYNGFFAVGTSKRSGVYISFGAYYRWLRQRWNSNWSTPFNYKTEDQEWYYQGVFGFQKSIGDSGSYYTFDINFRDNFSYYHLDNAAFEWTFNAAFSNSFLLRMNVGVRTSALFMGTGNISDNYAGLGFVLY